MTTAVAELGDVRDALTSALLARDSGRARRVVLDAADLGAPVEDLVLEVCSPALHEIGFRWSAGEITVAEEHYATAVVDRLLHTLGPRLHRSPAGGRLALVATTPGEQHALGARIVSDLLEADAWEVLHLGANTPAADLLDLAATEAPDLLALSTTTPQQLPHVAAVLGGAQNLSPRPFIAVGGQLWTRETVPVVRELGADWVGRDPRLLVAALREIVPPRAGD